MTPTGLLLRFVLGELAVDGGDDDMGEDDVLEPLDGFGAIEGPAMIGAAGSGLVIIGVLICETSHEGAANA